MNHTDTPPQNDTNIAPISSQRAQAILFGAVFLAVLLLYWFTLAPGVVGGDAGEHQFAVPLLGIPHTTGYPLYVLTGKLWTMLIPLGSMAWRMNLFSAFWGALAAAVTALVVYRLSILDVRHLHYAPAQLFTVFNSEARHNPKSKIPNMPEWMQNPKSTWPGALTAGIALSFGLTLWQWSTIAGVRPMNVFFFALLTLEAIIWAEQQQQHSVAAERTLRWLALTVGLSLAHHRTTIFYLPSLVGWIWWYDRHLIRQPKRLLTLALLSLAPLSLYLFIYLRGINNPPYTHEPIYNLQSFWFLVGSGDSQGLFFSIDPAYLPARLQFLWADLLAQLSWPGVILATIGGAILLRRRPDHFIFQSLLVALLLLFTLDFEVVNLNEAPAWYQMPSFFILAVWGGVAVNGILDFGFWILNLRTVPQPSRSVAPSLFTLLVITLFTFTLARPNWQTLRTVSTAPLDEWRQLLRGTQAQRFVDSSLPFVQPNAIIWGDWEQYTPLRYSQLINGVRPDVTARNPLNNWPEKIASAHKAGQPVYLARKPANLPGTPFLSMVGPLIHIGTQPQLKPPPNILPLNIDFENELELVGYRAAVQPQNTPGGNTAGPILQVTLYWRVPKKSNWDYALSLRLLDGAGREVFKKDTAHPVLSSYPTTLWTPGEVVGDFYELPLPPDVEPLTLHVLPYRTEGPGQWRNLTQSGTGEQGILLGPFETK